MEQKENRQDVALSAALSVPLWFALMSSVVEVVIRQVERQYDPLTRLSDDFVWMAPAALIAVTLLASLPGLLVAKMWSRRIGLALSVFAGASVATLNLLMLVPGLSHYAAAVLAVGAAVQACRLVLRDPMRIRFVVRRSTPLMIGCLVLVGAAVFVSAFRARSHESEVTAVSPRAPNVLLITLDTVRAANLGLYGYSRPTTPQIDQFAGRGLVFDRAFSTAPWTLPSHASLFTGRWPHELSADYESVLDGTYPTLAEYLARHGYQTAGFAANLGYCSFESGLGRGFAHYEDYPRSLGQTVSSSTLVRNVADNFNLRRLVQNDEHLNRVRAPDLNGRVLNWLSGRGSSPFFVFINYFDAHEPYLPPPPFDRRFGEGRKRGRYSPLQRWLWEPSVAHSNMHEAEVTEELAAYDGALAYLDDHVGQLLRGLDARGLLHDTLVVITADHGEEFGEHGVFEHGYSLYRAGLQVPLIMVLPDRIPGGQRIAAPVSLRDVPATIVETLGLDAGAPFPGKSLARFWRVLPPADENGEEPLLAELSRSSGQPTWFPSSKGDMKALVYRGLRYIRNGDGTEELYDLKTDQGEQRNLAPLSERRQALEEFRLMLGRVAEHVEPLVKAR